MQTEATCRGETNGGDRLNEGACTIPTGLNPLVKWLEKYFGSWNLDEKTRADIDKVFNQMTHRGNVREIWFSVLWIKVCHLRSGGATWAEATQTALSTWTVENPDLPPTWAEANYRARHEDKVDNLVQQMKNRIEDVSDLGIYQVTDAHFWLALVAGRFVVAARLYRAAKPRLRASIRNQLVEMASRIVP